MYTNQAATGSKREKKKYKAYEITRPDYSDVLKVRVYKTVKDMHKGALKINKDVASLTFTAAFCATHLIRDDNYGCFCSDYFGTVVLNEQNLSIAHISHECVHAAFSWDRNINRYYGNHNDYDAKERFVSYFDWLFIEVLQTLKKAGHKVK